MDIAKLLNICLAWVYTISFNTLRSYLISHFFFCHLPYFRYSRKAHLPTLLHFLQAVNKTVNKAAKLASLERMGKTFLAFALLKAFALTGRSQTKGQTSANIISFKAIVLPWICEQKNHLTVSLVGQRTN